MSSLSVAKTILAADNTLTATATGGVFVPDDLGRMGLDRSNPQAASAFDSDGSIKPCLLLKISSSQEIDGMSDDPAQKMGRRETLQIWFYQDNGYSTIDTMMARVYLDLQGKQLSGGGLCRLAFESQPSHDMDLDACMQWMNFYCWGIKSAT